MLNKIIKITPLFGALLVFCGVLKLIFYYTSFNINIIEYLEFQEIITSFFGDINILIIFGMSMLIISFMTLNFISKKTKLHLNDSSKNILAVLFPNRYLYSFFFLLIILILICLIYYEIFKYNYFIIYLLTFSMIQMLTYLFLSNDENEDIGLSNTFGVLILGSTLTFAIYLFAQNNIQRTENPIHETTIEMKNGVIHCNKQTKNLYIGKTSKYVFIKLDSLNSTIVIPTDEIIKYEFKKNK